MIVSHVKPGCSFARPVCLAKVHSGSVIVLCQGQQNLLYFLSASNGLINSDLSSRRIEHNLVSITSGRGDFFFALKDCRHVIFIYNRFFKVVGTHSLVDAETVTHISYDKETDELFVASYGHEGHSKLRVYSILENKEFLCREEHVLNQEEISGIIKFGSYFIISDKKRSELIELNILGDSRKVLAKYGRDGQGFVREPGVLRKYRDGFLVIDQNNYLVQYYSFDGKFVAQYGGKSSTIGGFDLPSDLLVDGDRFLVADMNNDRLVHYKYQELDAPTVVFSREFCPGKLSRPTSFIFHQNKIYISDRSNNIIQILDLNLNPAGHIDGFQDYPFSRPTSIQTIHSNGKTLLAVLSRPDISPPILALIDPDTHKTFRAEEMKMLSSPQGMITVDLDKLCVMDTLNRTARLFDSNLRQLAELNLAEISGNERFLCRVPSIVDGEIWFSDYHSELFVVVNFQFSKARNFSLSASNFKMDHIRKIIKHKNTYFIIGRGEKNLAVVVGDLISGKVIFPHDHLVDSVVDLCFVDNDIYILQKENDGICRCAIEKISPDFAARHQLSG